MTREFLIRKRADCEMAHLFGELILHANAQILQSVKVQGLKRLSAQGARMSDVSFDLHRGRTPASHRLRKPICNDVKALASQVRMPRPADVGV